jgi:hypothetical protein
MQGTCRGEEDAGVLSFDGMCIIACLQDVGTAYACSCVGKSHTWLFYLLRPVWSIHSEALSPCQGRLAVGPWWVVPALIFPLKPEAVSVISPWNFVAMAMTFRITCALLLQFKRRVPPSSLCSSSTLPITKIYLQKPFSCLSTVY